MGKSFKIETKSDYLNFIDNYIVLLEGELSKTEDLFSKWEKVFKL